MECVMVNVIACTYPLYIGKKIEQYVQVSKSVFERLEIFPTEKLKKCKSCKNYVLCSNKKQRIKVLEFRISLLLWLRKGLLRVGNDD